MTLIVGTDFSSSAHLVESAAADLARRRGEELVLAHVVDGPLLPRSLDADRLEGEARRVARQHSCAVRTQLLFDGNVGKRLAELAEAERATLLVVGAHGVGLRSSLGSVARMAIRHSRVPLLVVREASRLWLKQERLHALATIAVDDTDAGAKAALALLASTGDFDAEVVHYQALPEALPDRAQAKMIGERELRDELKDLALGARVLSIAVRDGVGDVVNDLCLLASQHSADVIVCGSHHRQGLQRMLEGSLAERIAERATISVLVGAAPVASATLRDDREPTDTSSAARGPL